MIYVDVKGNLGNQLFIYAFAKSIQKKTHQIICLNTTYLNRYYPNYVFSLDDYVLNENVYIEKKEKLPYFMNVYSVPSKILMKCLAKIPKLDKVVADGVFRIYSKKGYYLWLKETFVEIPFELHENYYITGFWQSPQYLIDIKEELREELKPKYHRLEHNKTLYHIIETCESICVTIRRGDYVNDGKIRKNYFVCDKNYFYEGVSRIKKAVPNAVVVCFSDDIEWVKENMDFNCETYYESGKDPVWEKLRLMSLCKHFVLSNSSFSWWAEYLSENKDKLVIAPSRWYADNRPTDIDQDYWQYIDV